MMKSTGHILKLSMICACALAAFSAQGSTAIQGCPIYPDNNAWNRDISADPIDPNSANYIAFINAGGKTLIHPDFGSSFGIPFIVVPGTQPMVPINIVAYPGESDPPPYPIPSNAPVEGNGAPGDRHVLVLDKDNGLLYEMGNSVFTNPGWTCDGGAVFDLKSNVLRPDGFTSSDAAGLPILPGLARYDETTAGAITHALRFTVRATAKGYIHPATHYASTTTDPNAPPMGLRLRLKASYSLAGLTGQALVVATALKKYGMIVADNGSDWFISGEQNAGWNDTDLNQLKTLPGNMFEVVQSGPVISLSSSPQPAPTVVSAPSNQTVSIGQGATFTVVASGTGTIQYQWQKNGVDINGARVATYFTPPTLASDTGSVFRVVVTTVGGAVTSASATLTVTGSGSGTAPSITSQPASATVTAGQTATFSVAASGTAPLSYQWQKNGVNIASATGASYTTPPTTAADSGSSFKCVVSNSVGSAISNAATVTVNAANTPPAITSAASATPATATVGQTVSFNVAATDGDGDTVIYSWSFGDGGSASTASAAHTYAAAGTFTATATATDSAGKSVTSSVTVTVTPKVTPTLHVAGISMSLSSTSRGKAALATVSIKDASGVSVSGATVSGTWSGLTSAKVAGNTNSAGSIRFTSARTKSTGTFTFTVTNVTAAGYSYASNQNAVSSKSISTAGQIVMAAASIAGAAMTAPTDSVALNSVKANQTFKLVLPRPTDIPSSGAVRTTSMKLPAGARTSAGSIGGKITQVGTYNFTVQFQAKTTLVDENGMATPDTVVTEQQYTLTVSP